MKVTNELKIYEINGTDLGIKAAPFAVITVESHWNRDELVVIRCGDTSYTVSANQLQAALKNATNWR